MMAYGVAISDNIPKVFVRTSKYAVYISLIINNRFLKASSFY